MTSHDVTEWQWNCSLGIDPQGVAAQTVGYVKLVLLVAHAIPSAVKVWKERDGSLVPTKSLAIRTVLALLSVAFGVAICQLPEIIGGAASFIVFATIIAAKIRFAETTAPRKTPVPNSIV